MSDTKAEFNIDTVQYQPINHSKGKWTKYFNNDLEVKPIELIRYYSRLISFEYISIVNVGITTGNNKYFSVDRHVVDKYEFKDVVLPLIEISSHAYGIYFADQDWQYNGNLDKKAFLISFP